MTQLLLLWEVILRNLFFAALSTWTFSFALAADSGQVYSALAQVRQAQAALYQAESALVASLQSPAAPVTCRIKTALYTYEAEGPNTAVAISNARLKCKNSGTIPSVCDNAVVDVCW